MKWIVAMLIAGTALAGCSQGGHPLDPYVMDVLDAPDACYYIDIQEDDEAARIAAFVGMTSNPGSLDEDKLSHAGFMPQDNRYAFFECKFSTGVHRFASGAVAFEDGAEARAFLDASVPDSPFVTCEGHARVFVDGAVVGVVADLDGDRGWPRALEARVDAFMADRLAAGGSDECARLAQR